MTRDEAHNWLEANDPEKNDFCLEWLGGVWIAYRWIAPAGARYTTKKGSFVVCVNWIKKWVDGRTKKRGKRLSPHKSESL